MKKEKTQKKPPRVYHETQVVTQNQPRLKASGVVDRRSLRSVFKVKAKEWGTGVMGRPHNTVFQQEAALARKNLR